MIQMQYKGRQLMHNQWLAAAALLFFLANMRADGSASPAVYGDWATRVDAGDWALGFFAAAVMALLGILINGRWRWSPALRIIGYVTQIVMFSGLAASALSAPYGSAILAFTCGYFLPISVKFLRLNVIDAIVRWRDYRDSVALK